MSTQPSSRNDLLAALEEAGRKYSESSVLFHHAIADSLGLNVTDLKCLGLIRESDGLTPGQLAKLMGLTTGAVTGIVDRLEMAGYAQRRRDSIDRRKISIHAQLEQISSQLNPIVTSFQQAMASEFNHTYSDQDMALILDFVKRSSHILQTETRKIQQQKQQP